MQYTDNNGLIIKEKTDNYSRENFNKCMNIIDDGLCKFYVATLESTNNYKVTTGLNKTGLNDGYSIKVAIPSDSNGAVSIIVDSVTVPVKKPNGNPVCNFKQNGVYSLTYYNGNFILASGSDESDSTSVGTTGDKVLAGETFIGSDGEVHTGQIPIRNAVNTTLKAGQSVSLDSGYYKDKSTIKAETLATAMTNAGVTLTSTNQLVKDVKAVDKNGNLITGTATIQSLGGVPFHKTVGKAHFEVDSGSYGMFHPQINFDYDVLEGYWYHTDIGDTKDSRHYFYINKRYWSTSDMYLLSDLPYGASKTNVDDNNPPSGSTSGSQGIRRRYCSNTTGINTYQLLNNPKISTYKYSSNPNLDITVVSFAYKI